MLRSLRKKRRKRVNDTSHQNDVGGFLTSVVALAVSVFMLTACATTMTGRSALHLYSDSFMSKLGHNTFEQIKKEKKLEQDIPTNRYVRCITDRLIQALPKHLKLDDPKQWEVRVFKDTEPNAFALPGNKIGVHTGMLKVANDPDQLAAVIGHEIAHVLMHHSNERLSQNQLSFLGLMSIGMIPQSKENQWLLTTLGLGLQLGVLLPFSRLHESEADHLGLKLSTRAGFHPQGGVKVWENMAKQSKGKVPAFLSTHPSHAGRIRHLQQLQQEMLPIYQAALKQGHSGRCVAPR